MIMGECGRDAVVEAGLLKKAAPPPQTIRTVVRVRPLLPHELQRRETSCADVEENRTRLVLRDDPLVPNRGRLFSFHRCFPPETTQWRLFEGQMLAGEQDLVPQEENAS